MKHALLTLAIFMMMALSIDVAAQTNQDVAFNYLPSGTSTPGDKIEETKVAGVHVKATRNFNRLHKNTPDARWSVTEKGSSVSFSSNGTNTKILYDNKGRSLYTIISYTESHLDPQVIELVKSKYYDNTIIGVHQFEFENKTVYVIKMQDELSNPVTLKVCDGQVEDITSYAKK